MSRTVIAAAALVALAPAVVLTSSASSVATDRAAPEAQRADTYAVTARINRVNVIADQDVVRVSGRVRPLSAGQKVVLQQRREGKKRWTKTGTATIKKTGSFVLKDFPSSAGVRFYRVLKPAAHGIAAGRSKELEVTVWAWRRLALNTPGASAGVYIEDTPQIGTVPFPTSLSLERPGVPGYAEYTLGRTCRSLRATYALTDTSLTGATGRVSVTVDGVVRAVHELAIGTIVRDEYLDVGNAFRIRFDLSASASPSGWSAVGTPEVLCSR